MLELLNSYAHGYLAIPVIMSCREHGMFELFQNGSVDLSNEQLAKHLQANSGNLQIALRLLHSMNWIMPSNQDNNKYRLISKKYELIPEDILDLFQFPFEDYLLNCNSTPPLYPWFLRSMQRWAINDSLLADFLDGLLVIPLLLAMRRHELIVSKRGDQFTFSDKINLTVCNELFQFFQTKKWIYGNPEIFYFSNIGAFIWERIFNNAALMSYFLMFSHIDTLLFGDAKTVFQRQLNGQESHIDRTLNVIGSGFQHEHYFADLTDTLGHLFNRIPYDEQPKYIIDMGCGDGTLLKRIYQYIESKTGRGLELANYPLVMIGVDYNVEALVVTRETLKDIPHLTLKGDINDPEKLLADLRAMNISDPDDMLHVRSFLDHDRPYLAPKQRKHVAKYSQLMSSGVYVDELGQLIPPCEMMQSLVEHFQRWAKIIGRHGLMILEVHCLPPQTVYNFLNQCENLHFDAYHSLSKQSLVEPEYFLIAASEAGLLPIPQFTHKYPRILPFARITLNWFKPKPYHIRCAQLSEIKYLCEIGSSSSSLNNATTKEEIQRHIQKFSQGQCVLTREGEICAVIYTKRIKDVKLPQEHDPKGTVIYISAFNVLPAKRELGIARILLEFVIQYSGLQAGITKIRGTIPCNVLSKQPYVHAVDANGLPLDPEVRFFCQNGAVLQKATEKDVEGQDIYEIYIEYDLQDIALPSLPRFHKPVTLVATLEQTVTRVEESVLKLMRREYFAYYTTQTALRDLGFDSLNLLELQTLLSKQFKVELNLAFFFSYSTIEKMAEYLHQFNTNITSSHVESIGSPQKVSPLPFHKPVTAVATLEQTVTRVEESVLKLMRREQFSHYTTQTALRDLGFDSLNLLELQTLLSKEFKVELNLAFFFSYSTVEKIAEHLHQFNTNITSSSAKPIAPPQEVSPLPNQSTPLKFVDTDIAIVGMSGRFPGAENLTLFWKNIANGVQSVDEIPKERWDINQHYDSDPAVANKTYSRVGSFLQDIDKFDPLFFNISPKEAELIDPQQRIFLEEAWRALEDAGYTDRMLTNMRCGVFVGAAIGEYGELLNKVQMQNESYAFMGLSPSILASRISYFLNLKGPSLAIDTACSSSLVAVNLACESLLTKQCDIALAGGVSTLLTPQMHIKTAKVGMLSPSGVCRTFDKKADGITLGEGVGVIVLKPLQQAIQDRNIIYGVIKASGINQDGSSNGITAPNPDSQTELELEVYRKANISPETISYVEAHGTGTPLGDPVEVSALTRAFRQYTNNVGYCAIGSVKTNIGHTTIAAGISSFIKILLALKHKKIPPHLNFSEINDNIKLENSPFYINSTLREWQTEAGMLRRAAVSSFGFSGTNAHVVVEEAPEQFLLCKSAKPCYLVTLSAKNKDALMQRIVNLHTHIKTNPGLHLEAIAYTLNVGRSHFNHRCALVISSMEELQSKLEKIQKQEKPSGCFQGDTKNGLEDKAIYDRVLKSIVEELNNQIYQDANEYKKQLEALGNLYVRGYEVDWVLLHRGEAHQKISLPTYPFLKERYWITEESASHLLPSQTHSFTQIASKLHPLLDDNASTLEGQCYQTLLQADAFYLRDHVIKGKKILPGVCSLEMARIGGALARPSSVGVCELKHVIWQQPIVVESPKEISLYLHPKGERVEYEVYSKEEAEYSLHSQGEVVYGEISARPEALDIEALQQSMEKEFSHSELYKKFRAMGIHYGPSFQGLQYVKSDGKRALGYVVMPQEVSQAKDYSSYLFHPSFLDSVLQTIMVFNFDEKQRETYLPFGVEEVKWFVTQFPEKAYVLAEADSRGTEEMPCYQLQLADERGNLILQFKGFRMRAVELKKSAKVFKNQNISSSQAELALYQTKLEEVPLSSLDQANTFVTGVLTVDVSTKECERLKAALDCTVVGFSKEDLIHHETLAEKIAALPANISHLLYLVSAEKENDTALAVESLFVLTKELLRSKRFSTLSSYYICRFSNVNPPLDEMTSGFIKSLGQEQPSYRFHLLTCEAKRTEAEVLNLWLQEINHAVPAGAVIRYNGSKRYEERFQPITMQSETNTKLPLREKGTYLITGGLGGLGFLFARYLATRYQAKLILTGRSLLDDSKKAQLKELEKLGSEVLYVTGDISQKPAVQNILVKGKNRFGGLHGIIHSAGIIKDSLLVHKSIEDFRAVLAPKVEGLIHLDTLTAEDPIELFVMFSSMSSVLGNVGQSDYASANAFLDNFSHWRQAQVQANRRRGKTLSINWPLWLDGGMQVDSASQEYMESRFGMKSMPTDKGFEAFEQFLSLSFSQGIVAYGEANCFLEILSHLLPGQKSSVSQSSRQEEKPNIEMLDDTLIARTQIYLKKLLQNKLKLPEHKLDIQTAFDQYGLDSILILDVTRTLEKDFGILPKTLFFEYRTITELSRYFIQSHKGTLEKLLKEKTSSPQERITLPPAPLTSSQHSMKNQSTFSDRFLPQKIIAQQVGENNIQTSEDIAIVGLSGRYPDAKNLQEFWKNLQQGHNAVREIPEERWDWRLHYDANKSEMGKSYGKSGSFIQDFDKFDPLFFNISPREAELMDPQERLFLEVVWATLEDAGYTPEGLNENTNNKIGVFVGVMYGPYQLYGSSQDNLTLPTSFYASIANHVSYSLNFHGPSLAVDTMCSSSLTAIHLACESIKRGECQAAIAGGVNITSHPSKYLVLSQGRFLSSDGLCKSFGEGGDGYVPGEGVGAVLLKHLSQALSDGDEIYGVIKGSSVNHGGKTNGYTVPNPVAQGELIQNALKQASVVPQSLSYIEAHGTGTSLGDPIEIRGLDKAFEGVEKQSCPIGSIKSNLGHLESAAGIAALTKVLLQFKYKQLVPSIHAETLNPHIPFAETPFYVQRELADWQTKAGYPLRAGISSFGAGGSNAHLILEEAPKQVLQHGKRKPYYLVTLSAKHQDSLKQQIADLHIYLRDCSDISLESLAYTLNVGRSHFNFRCAVVASTIEEFKIALEKLQLAQTPAGCFRGQADKAHEDGAIYKKVLKRIFEELKTIELTDLATYKENMEALANLYIKGYQLDWKLLHHGESHQKVRLPTYPFLKERYWLSKETASSLNLSQVLFEPVQRALHPLLDKNISTFESQIYQKTLLPTEVVLAHHQVFDQAILPGTAYLEMARAAGTLAGGRPITRLKDVMWQIPIVSKGVPIDVRLKLHPTENGQGAIFQMFTNVDDKLLLHAKGELEYESAAPSIPISLIQGEDLKSVLARCEYLFDKTQMYARLKKIGFDYGQSFQVTQALYGNAYEGVALLCLPQICQGNASQHVLHPMLLDGALRAIFAIQHQILRSSDLYVPFYMESLEIYRELPSTVYSYARLVSPSGSEKQEKPLQHHVIDVDILTEQGELCVSFRGFKALPFRREEIKEGGEETKEVCYYYQPQWTDESLASSKKDLCHLNNLMVLSEPHDAFSASLISGISSNGMEPWPDIVLQILPSTVTDGENSTIGSMEASYLKGLLDWLQFFKTWQGTAPEKPLHYVMVYEATSPTAQPYYAALASLSRAVKLLSPNLTMSVLGVHPENTRRLDWIERLHDELHHRQDKSVYYASTGQRLVRRLIEILPANPFSLQSLPLRKEGIYLITGGCGGLGKHFARFLSKGYQAKIIILGRSSLDDDKKQFLAELKALGGEAYYISVDIGTSQIALEIALTHMINQVGEIQGVIHAAGVVNSHCANVVENADFLRACEVKVDGTVHLDRTTQTYPLDFFVTFSSISSELGDFGVGSYAFSNRFMDEFMHWRADQVQQGLRRGLSLSIQWPYWKEGGMHMPAEAMRVYQDYSGFDLLDTEQGLASFHSCLSLGLANVLVAAGDKEKLERILGIMRIA